MGEDSASCTKLNIPTCRVQTSQGLALDITRRGFALGCLALQCFGARPGAKALDIRRPDVQLWTSRAATKVYRGRVTIS